MALVSPGVEVRIIDESFYVPVSAPTVPLFFIATNAGKTQPNGITPATGTNEHSVVRTVTSISQSTSLYGIPAFREDVAGNALHGDCRNEYGLFAMNQFLGVGNRAYCVRADVDLSDASITTIAATTPVFVGVGNGTMVNVQPEQLAVPQTVTVTFLNPTTYTTFGSVTGAGGNGTTGTLFDNNIYTFTINSGSVPFQANDEFTVTFAQTIVSNPLGANDAAKRVAITTALQAEINSNQDVRSEVFEYNLILCPGYPEVVDELLALNVSINEEAFVIADTPFTLTPEQTANWAMTSERFHGTNVGYYYPHSLSSNLDGKDVFVAASGTALRTFAYSDNVSELWFAPAGIRRGLVTGVSKVGIVSGTLGAPTTFVEINLNQGQRDILYEFFKNINPTVFFPGRGLIVWGQKTSSPAASALDRVNVVRLLCYIKRSLRKASMPFVFEPNDARTRDDIKAMIDNFLGDIMIRRGLYDFLVVCDESNNTPARIDRNECWVDVAVKPTKALEFLYIPIRVLATGAPMGTN